MAKRPLIEVRSIDYVPKRERHGKVWHLWPVWFMGDAHLATIATGDSLEILATDPGSVKDFESFCRQTGHELVSATREGDVLIFVIRKR